MRIKGKKSRGSKKDLYQQKFVGNIMGVGVFGREGKSTDIKRHGEK